MKKILITIISLVILIPSLVRAYTVKKGDTLWGLFGSKWGQIAVMNNISDPRSLRIGQELITDEMLGANALPTDNYDSFLTSPLSASASTVYVNAIPTGVSSTIYTLYASDGTTPREKISCTGTATSPNQLTGCTRGISFSPVSGVISETAGTGLSHSKNTRIAITDNVNFTGKALAILNGDQATGASTFLVGTVSTSGMQLDGANKKLIAYNNGTNPYIKYDTSTAKWQWSEDGTNYYNFTSSSVSTLTAGSDISIVAGAINVSSTVTSSAGVADGGKLVKLRASDGTIDATLGGTAGSLAQLDANQKVVQNPASATSTPTASSIPIASASSTLDPNWLPNGYLITQSYTAGESIDASSIPLAVYLNSTDGRVYKTSSAVATTTFTFIGFAQSGQNKTAGQSISVQQAGLVSGFTGMATGSVYFVSTAGTVSSTAGTIQYQVGISVSPTTLLIEKGRKIISANVNADSSNNTYIATTTISTGFIPSKIVFSGCYAFSNTDCAESMESPYAYYSNGTTYGWTLNTSSAVKNSTYLYNGASGGNDYGRIRVFSVTKDAVIVVFEGGDSSGVPYSINFDGYLVIEE